MTEQRTAAGKQAIVIGAGVVGICCALYLQRDGWQVTVLDPGAPSIVPGRAEMLFQFRDTDFELLERMHVALDEIVATIDAAYPLEPVERGNEPAARWRFRDGAGEIGVIASVTQAFCGNCDRMRLTAEGQFRNCLFAVDEFDLRALVRSGASDDDLAAEIQRGVLAKWAGHQINQVHFIRPKRSMSQIGG